MLELQKGKCFFCRRPLAGASHVDHFIPWARYASNALDNLVVAHEKCNLSKSDYLAAPEHVERWLERMVLHSKHLDCDKNDERGAEYLLANAR
ncbi:MAG: HNH endonuclease [Deltaproteobacteria bacterium]|nr:HNH endonuclease [Deltaproteobacteria bacterium]